MPILNTSQTQRFDNTRDPWITSYHTNVTRQTPNLIVVMREIRETREETGASWEKTKERVASLLNRAPYQPSPECLLARQNLIKFSLDRINDHHERTERRGIVVIIFKIISAVKCLFVTFLSFILPVRLINDLKCKR